MTPGIRPSLSFATLARRVSALDGVHGGWYPHDMSTLPTRSFAATCAVFALPALTLLAGCEKKPAETAPPPPAGSTSMYNDPAAKGGGSQAERAADVEQKADEANAKLAKVIAIAIRVGAAIWMANDERCPTTEDLIKIKFVNEKVQTNDPWGQPYKIVCTEKEPVVTSAGPDGKLGTADDIVAGK